MGRPKMDAKNRKSIVVEVLLSPSEKDFLERRAEMEGRALSTYLRNAGLMRVTSFDTFSARQMELSKWRG